jgi:hypothetical protein
MLGLTDPDMKLFKVIEVEENKQAVAEDVVEKKRDGREEIVAFSR